MISPELIRRYPYFGGLDHDQIVTLAKVASEVTADAGHYFFHEGDKLDRFFLVLEGSVAIVMEVPAKDATQTVAGQLTGELETTDVVVSAVGPGEIFGWSALIPPYIATAGGKATTPCRVATFDCTQLLPIFDEDCAFGYVMTQKAAQVIRGRLHDVRIESLAHFAD